MPTFPSTSKSMYLETDHEYATYLSSMTDVISSPIKLYTNEQKMIPPQKKPLENRKTVNRNKGHEKTQRNAKYLPTRG